MKISLAYSPCPNDCFIFDAIANNRIDTKGFQFEIHLADVEQLNNSALNYNKGKSFDICKLSFATLMQCTNKYSLLASGGAMGFNCGPLLIAKNKIDINSIVEKNLRVAIPGENTTANFLLKTLIPNIKNKQTVLFSEIEDGILNGDFDAGIIIHENRFTYLQKGLQKIMDLGEEWQNKTSMPIPLGGIGIKKSISLNVQIEIRNIIKESIIYAFKNPIASKKYIKENAQEMEDDIIQKHINLYVNEFSIDINEEAFKGIKYFFEKNGYSVPSDYLIK